MLLFLTPGYFPPKNLRVWLVPPLSIRSRQMRSKQRQCGVFGSTGSSAEARVSLGFHVWLAAQVALKEMFLWKRTLSWDNHVILWWLITVKLKKKQKKKTSPRECPFFLLWYCSRCTQARTPTHTHTHTHTHTKYRKWKWLTATEGQQSYERSSAEVPYTVFSSVPPVISAILPQHTASKRQFFTRNCLCPQKESIGHHLYDTIAHSLNHLHWPIYSLLRKGHYWNRKLYFIIALPRFYPLSEIGSPEYTLSLSLPLSLFSISLYLSLLSVREGDFDRLTVSPGAITTLHLYPRRVH